MKQTYKLYIVCFDLFGKRNYNNRHYFLDVTSLRMIEDIKNVVSLPCFSQIPIFIRSATVPLEESLKIKTLEKCLNS